MNSSFAKNSPWINGFEYRPLTTENPPRVDLLEEAQTNILLKASRIPPCDEITIGPQSTIAENYSYFGVNSLEYAEKNETPQNGAEVENGIHADEAEDLEILNTVTTATVLQGLEELRKAEVKDSVTRYADKIISLEQALQTKMNEELKLMIEEKQTKSKLKRKLIESSISDDDLVVSKMVSKIVEKYQQEKLKNEQKAVEEKRLQEQRESEARSQQERVASIQKIYVQYKKVYENINENMKNCKVFSKFTEMSLPDLSELKTLNIDFNNICGKIKTNSIENSDVETCSMIYQRSIQISNKLKDRIDSINKEFIAAEEKPSLSTIKEDQSFTGPEEAADTKDSELNDDTLRSCICKELHENYLQYKERLHETDKKIETFVNNKSLKKFILHLKIAINTPVNALSSANAMHMQDKYNKIESLLRGNFSYPAPSITPELKDLYYPFCIDYLCKKLINQGENLISSKSEDAFPLASLILALWIQFNEFGDILLAQLMKKCPYIIPAYWPQFKGQTDKEYYMSLGYRYNENDSVEDHNMFLRRMNGILMLYTAVMISEPRHNKPHPHGMRYAWRWLTAVLNLEPSPDITPSILHEFLKLAGYKLSQYYGLQFWKVIHFLYTEYYNKIDKVTADDFRGPLSRLKEFLETTLKIRRFPEPKGLIDPNFW